MYDREKRLCRYNFTDVGKTLLCHSLEKNLFKASSLAIYLASISQCRSRLFFSLLINGRIGRPFISVIRKLSYLKTSGMEYAAAFISFKQYNSFQV